MVTIQKVIPYLRNRLHTIECAFHTEPDAQCNASDKLKMKIQ